MANDTARSEQYSQRENSWLGRRINDAINHVGNAMALGGSLIESSLQGNLNDFRDAVANNKMMLEEIQTARAEKVPPVDSDITAAVGNTDQAAEARAVKASHEKYGNRTPGDVSKHQDWDADFELKEQSVKHLYQMIESRMPPVNEVNQNAFLQGLGNIEIDPNSKVNSVANDWAQQGLTDEQANALIQASYDVNEDKFRNDPEFQQALGEWTEEAPYPPQLDIFYAEAYADVANDSTLVDRLRDGENPIDILADVKAEVSAAILGQARQEAALRLVEIRAARQDNSKPLRSNDNDMER